MLYVAAAIWLTVVVLLAWAIRSLWANMVSARVVNVVTLPGTIVARFGYVLALLITGTAAGHVSLIDDTPAEDEKTPTDEPHLPFFGMMLVGLLPMLAVSVSLYFLIREFGGPLVERVRPERLESELPVSLPAFWEQLRQLVTLAEDTFNAIRHLDWSIGPNVLFVYLLICLSLRMAPIPRHLDGHLAAIVATALAAALVGSAVPSVSQAVAGVWPGLALVTGCLLCLLMISLSIRGLVEVGQVIRR